MLCGRKLDYFQDRQIQKKAFFLEPTHIVKSLHSGFASAMTHAICPMLDY